MERYQAQALIDQRASAWTKMTEVITRADEEKRSLTAEEQQTWSTAREAVKSLTESIDAFEETRQLDEKFSAIDVQQAEAARRAAVNGGGESHVAVLEQPDPEEQYERAFRTALFDRAGLAALDAEGRQLFASKQNDVEARAQGISTGVAGGYAAPLGFWSKITETMKWYGGMLDAGCETVTTNTGNPLQWPTNDDTANTGSWLGAENVAIPDATGLTFGLKSLFAHVLTSNVEKVSWQYLQDVDPIAAEGFITKKLGQRLGRTLNTALTVGDGVAKPYGLINGLTTGVTAASATVVTYTELVKLVHSVDIAYRNLPGTKFMMHDLVLSYFQGLLDSYGRPLWSPGMSSDAPATLIGYPYVINNDMDSTVATTKKTVAFGNFGAAYVIRDVTGGQVRRLDERYADVGQVGFLTFARYDGLIQDASAVKLLVQA
jgi:HK97 family phage major capsid protein